MNDENITSEEIQSTKHEQKEELTNQNQSNKYDEFIFYLKTKGALIPENTLLLNSSKRFSILHSMNQIKNL